MKRPSLEKPTAPEEIAPPVALTAAAPPSEGGGGRGVGRVLGATAGVLATALALLASSNSAVPACAPAARVPAVSAAGSPAEAVVLVTIDGVRWQEIFQGLDRELAARAHLPAASFPGPRELLPNLYRLFFEGGTVLGDPRLGGGMSASGPNYVSLPGYVELATGARTECRANDCVPALPETIADEAAGPGASPPGASAVFASWERIARAASRDPSRVRIHAGRQGSDAAPAFPGIEGYLPDHFTAALAIDHLVNARPRFLWLALGDTDEWAHRGDYRGYVEALRAADAVVGELAAHLAEMGPRGERTALFVTADHGRDGGFNDHGGRASANVWLLARGPSIAHAGPVPTAQRRFLRDVAPTLRALLGLPGRACAGCGAPIDELLPSRLATASQP